MFISLSFFPVVLHSVGRVPPFVLHRCFSRSQFVLLFFFRYSLCFSVVVAFVFLWWLKFQRCICRVCQHLLSIAVDEVFSALLSSLGAVLNEGVLKMEQFKDLGVNGLGVVLYGQTSCVLFSFICWRAFLREDCCDTYPSS